MISPPSKQASPSSKQASPPSKKASPPSKQTSSHVVAPGVAPMVASARWKATSDVPRMMSAILFHQDAFLNRHGGSTRQQKDSGDTKNVQCWTQIALTFNDPNFQAYLSVDPDGRDFGMSVEPTGHQTTSSDLEKYASFFSVHFHFFVRFFLF